MIATAEKPVPSTPGDILVVDDDPRNLLTIEVALGDLGRRLVKVTSGAEALALLLQRDFALILLDVKMPSMDGIETARLIRLRTRSQYVPIIFITAFDRSAERVREAYKLGAVDFLFKPIAPEVLRAKAAVFVALQERTAQVAQQAELLREAERRAHDQRLEEARRAWEAEMLRRQVVEQRRAAEELARLNEELTQADRRKDEFLAMLAHELRNPLTPLLATLETLRSRHSTESERIYTQMKRQLHHLSRLVEDLLDVSRVNTGALELRTELTSLSETVEQAVSTCLPLLEESGQTLRLSLPSEPSMAFIDSMRIGQVLNNLLRNAAQHGRRGGIVDVSSFRDGDNLVVQVSDDGDGIPAELRSRIFEPFVQGMSGAGGLGVGLALVKRLLELHGGRVELDETPGGGATFRIRLPAADDHAALLPKDQPAEAQPASDHSLRIVVVEDSPDVREALGELLELWGHRVELASTAVTGMERIAEVDADVAIVDIGLPGLDGYEMARRLRASRPGSRPRLLALTGFGKDADRARAHAAGFDAHLTKPPDIEELRRALDGPEVSKR